MKKKKWIVIFLICCQLVGATIGGLLIYAEDHPNGKLNTMFTQAGFRLQ